LLSHGFCQDEMVKYHARGPDEATMEHDLNLDENYRTTFLVCNNKIVAHPNPGPPIFDYSIVSAI
jgi:hypothetical protein